MQQRSGLAHVPGQARWLHVTIVAIVLDEQGSIACFQHTVSCQIRGQSAGTPLLGFLHREITESLGNGCIRHEQHCQLREELYLSPASKDIPGLAAPPPGGWSRLLWSGSESEAGKTRTMEV